MSDRLEIKITGSNQASAAFQQVTRDATQMGNAVEQSGTKSTRSLSDLSAKSAAVGAAIGSATLILGEWSRASAEDTANQERLQRSVENTGKSYEEYTLQIEKAIKAGQDKAFGDDQTRDALVKLNTVTNDAGKSIEELGVTMDFARLKGISLSQSAEIIAKVYGGNLGILSRYGIVLEEGATATEALAKIQQISSGQAEVYANSQLGQLDKMKDKWGELTESIGASTGEFQQFLMLLPGLTAGYTALAGLVAGIGGLPVLGAAALLGGSGYLTYDVFANGGNAGPNTADSFFGGISSKAAGAVKKITPGSYGDSLFNDIQAQYQGILDSNTLEQIIAQMFFGVNTEGEVKAKFNSLIDKGAIPDMNLVDLPAYAQRLGLSVEELLTKAFTEIGAVKGDNGQFFTKRDFLARRFTTSGGYNGPQPGIGYTPPEAIPRVDPYNGMGIYNPFRMPNAASDGYTNRDIANGVPTYAAGGSGAVANGLSGIGNAAIVRSPEMDAAAAAAQTQMQTDALIAQYPAWEKVITGINSANDAQVAFSATQSGLMGEMGVYSQQQSEYSGQLSAMEEAHNLLNQRVAEGIPLTQSQKEFQENYNTALEIGTGAVEDTVLAQGTLAQQLLLNKGTMDEYKTANEESVSATGSLTDAVLLLIETLGGVPDDVRTQITLDGEAELHAALDRAVTHLNNIDGQTATFYINAQGNGLSLGNPSGPGINNNENRLGGVVGYRNGGVMAQLAEAGPELLHFRNGGSAWAMNRGIYNVPRGTYVDTAPASKLKAGGNQGGGITITGPVYVYPATGDVQREFTNALVGDWRTG